jgi:demethylmenaquinone methyltransferase / 2-methoxy-6-polyprenyl-1,4-benzoquinol methylase
MGNGEWVNSDQSMLPHPVIKTRFETEAQKPDFVNQLFDRGARYYDGVVSWGFLGSGSAYRRWALRRHGLRPGQRLLDVGCGTGLVALEAARILGSAENITCLDPSAGMLAVAKRKLHARFLQGGAEEIPLPDGSFDFLTMGYALRHVASLDRAFREYHRVLANGGKVLLLEITKPSNRFGAAMLKVYFNNLYPRLTRIFTGSEAARDMVKYYWETIEACVRPELILEALQRTGFRQVKRAGLLGVVSEYSGVK